MVLVTEQGKKNGKLRVITEEGKIKWERGVSFK